ncbi:DUF1831 domain-containing protein [Lacticaseibacillus sharpeae]|uniref:Cysteine desulfurase n=1 Tax=Lacticaseibacillus sharpeae JCM 1186 = DSM 20505 TaxID=1291052 RepID=A0A0R1ZJX7_9LACO|nr:DUF1831 domain-containing protein [Lacticaseibacillus sharpeae]KRM54757.1 hypothetical protein FC18_GL002171 [Lacticaseibacillus sharpeae JCM 1186 = DSM 20505]
MALTETVKVLGDSKTYKLSPNVKRYTLMDTGFMRTKNGGFQMERALDPNSPFTSANKLRITVSKDLDKFSMSVTTANGLRAVDIFKSDKTAANVEQYNYVLENLLERQVLAVVD